MKAILIENNFERKQEPHEALGVGNKIYSIEFKIKNFLKKYHDAIINTKLYSENITDFIINLCNFRYIINYNYDINYPFSNCFSVSYYDSKIDDESGYSTYNLNKALEYLNKFIIGHQTNESVSFTRNEDSYHSLGIGSYDNIKKEMKKIINNVCEELIGNTFELDELDTPKGFSYTFDAIVEEGPIKWRRTTKLGTFSLIYYKKWELFAVTEVNINLIDLQKNKTLDEAKELLHDIIYERLVDLN